jgi:hypothetical protein
MLNSSRPDTVLLNAPCKAPFLQSPFTPSLYNTIKEGVIVKLRMEIQKIVSQESYNSYTDEEEFRDTKG